MGGSLNSNVRADLGADLGTNDIGTNDCANLHADLSAVDKSNNLSTIDKPNVCADLRADLSADLDTYVRADLDTNVRTQRLSELNADGVADALTVDCCADAGVGIFDPGSSRPDRRRRRWK